MVIASRWLPATAVVSAASFVLVGCQLIQRHQALGIPETQLVPATSPIAVTLRTDWEALAQGAPRQRAAWQAQVAEMKTALQTTGIDYSRDIQPWIGGTATVALLGIIPQTQAEPALALVTTSRDPQQSQVLLQSWQTRLLASQQSIPEGQMFVAASGSPGKTLTLAQVRHQGQDYVAITNDPWAMEQLLAVLRDPKNHPPLATHKPFLSLTQAHMDERSWLAAHLNIPALIQATGALQAFTDTDLDTPLIRGHLQGMQALSFHTHWTRDGIGMDYRIQVDPNNPWMQTTVQPSPGKIVRRLPGDALAVFTSAYPAQIWQETAARLQTLPEARQAITMARGSLALLAGLDLDRDVIGWMNGELAVALVGDPGQPVTTWGGVVAIETSDKTTSEATWNRLDSLVRTFGGSVRAEAGGVVTWGIPGVWEGLQRFWLDPYLVVTSNPGLGSRMRAGTGTNLENSPVFGSLLRELPRPNYGYVLLNGAVLPTVAKESGVKWTPEARALWSSITAIGGTSYRVNNSTYAAQVRVQMRD